MQPLVSIVVPVYKVEDCLIRCLDSLYRQSMRDIEIILVDDASPDRSGEICDEFVKKDSRFIAIHHSENKGLSAARNTGIEHASGKYLMFVDSDDYVHEDFCKLPYECAIRYQADLVLFQFQRFNNKGTLTNSVVNNGDFKNVTLFKKGYKTKSEALELLLRNDSAVRVVAWNKLYNKNLFENVSYPEGYLFEDVGTTYKTVLKATSIFYLDKVLYYKCFHAGSLVTLRTKKVVQDWVAMNMQQYHDLMASGIYPIEKLDLYLLNIALVFCMMKKHNSSDMEYIFFANILQSYKKIPEAFTPKLKAMFMLFKYCLPLFELVCMLLGKKCSD